MAERNTEMATGSGADGLAQDLGSDSRDASRSRTRRFLLIAFVDTLILSGLIAAAFAIIPGNPGNPGDAAVAENALMEKWNGWITETVGKSKNDDTAAILVVKSSYTLYLLESGEITAFFPVELGWSPSEDKLMEGDGATPEGKYKVSEKRDTGKTRFYRGFLINFPNEKDREEYRANKSSGAIPASAGIGGLIMIHGKGSGKRPGEGGSNWTLGCVALRNEDIDTMFGAVTVGTPVTIVKKTDLPQFSEGGA